MQSFTIKIYNYILYQLLLNLKLYAKVFINQELFAQSNELLLLHQNYHKTFKHKTEMLIKVDTAFSVVYFSQNFISVQLQLWRIIQLPNLVSFYLVFHHFIDDFLSSLKNLSNIHIHIYILKNGFLAMNLLNEH